MPDCPTYIVTGGAGFIGSNLVAALLKRSPHPRVIVIDNLRSGSFANLVEACERAGVGPYDGELLPLSSADAGWDNLIAEASPAAVFHLGAITDTTLADEATMIRENVRGFADLLAACDASPLRERAIPVVYASSAATYGTPPQTRDRIPFPESAAGSPNNVYGFSKWLMENEHRAFVASRRPFPPGRPLAPARIVGLRYFNVFGPGEARKGKMASMVYQLARQMLAGKPPRIFREGSQARDQVYIDDVVDCTLAAAGLGPRPDPASAIYNLGSGVATTFNHIIDALRQALDIPAARLPTDYFDMPEGIRAFYQDYTCADMSAAAAGLSFKPRHNPLDASKRYAQWLKESSSPK